MKARMLLIIALSLYSVSAFAFEEDPVEKVRLAVAEADLVLDLATKATAEDPLLDRMCLRLGRYSAISRRIRDSIPVPPEETRIHYVHYENFCGWEPRPTDKPVENMLPRAYNIDPQITLDIIRQMAIQLKVDRDQFDAWRAEHAKP